MTPEFDELQTALIGGNHVRTAEMTQSFVTSGATPQDILEKGLLPAMQVVGRRFRDGEVFLPEVLVAARAMKSAMAVLEPLLAAAKYQSKGKVVLGTVKGDVHDIGKNLVGVMLRGAGFEVVDIGTGCAAEKFVDAVRKHQPHVLGLSALLTTTMTYMKTVIDTLRSSGMDVPVIVGGAPVNAEFAQQIGAAGTARTAGDAVELVHRLIPQA
ncbi:MAG: methyltransferase [Ignavibacteria bacterium RIFCSPLOWO2_02_FULL_55_14]|nr:MAG: methyltransferase [Ignavibacteria bacterium RIFCSPLOWO2_02_FULL_55_14]OGU76405.1 MAG: methyltransferase [Ignavibacteria bacterium RIFCSPLOWO2_12_FULL_56_21]